MPQKKITLEDLAAMVKKGFDEQREHADKRFTEVDSRFSEVEEQLTHLKDGLDQVNLKLTDQETLLYRIDRRTHSQQEQLEDHELRLQRVEK